MASPRGPLPRGKVRTVIDDSPTSGGSRSESFPIDADSILVSLFVESVSGSLDVSVKSFTESGKEIEVITFPTITSSTANLVIKKAAAVMSNIRIDASYTDAVTYEVRARGISIGEASIRILGPADGRASQIDVSSVTPTLLIPSSLDDRVGLIIKNNDSSTNIFLGYESSEATTSNGYPLGPGESLGIDIASGQELYAFASSGTVDVRIMEAGG